MRKLILIAIMLLLIGAMVSAVAVLALKSSQNAIEAFEKQAETLTDLATVNVELGVAEGRIDAVTKFLSDLQNNPIFVGAVIYDSDKDLKLRTVPESFRFSAAVEKTVLETGEATDGPLSFMLKKLKVAEAEPESGEEPEEPETTGYFLLTLTTKPMNEEANAALKYTAINGSLILLPVTILIALLLSWMEKKLREGEMRVLAINREIEIMLNNLDQGIFTFNPDGTVNAGHSVKAETLFGITEFARTNLPSILGLDDKNNKIFDQWIDLVQVPRIFNKWDRNLKLNPVLEIDRQIEGKRQVLELDYRPIIQDGSLQRIMVLGSDVTSQRELQDALERSKHEQEAEMARILGVVRNDKTVIDEFISSVENYLDEFAKMKDAEDLRTNRKGLYRELHTLKGNAGSVGFSELGTCAIPLEDLFADASEQLSPETFGLWRDRLEKLKEEFTKVCKIRNLLFRDGFDRMSISREKYLSLMDRIDRGELQQSDLIWRELHALNAQSFGSYCEKYQRILTLYRSRANKNIQDLVVHQGERMIHRDLMKIFDPCIVHLIRNAIDHGIESDEGRKEHGKEAGKVEIHFEPNEEYCTVMVTDDGKGVDAEAISRIAVDKKVITAKDAAQMSDKEKIHLIFRSGFSTKEKTTETSGRGVGMDAVQSFMHKRGGSVMLDTRVGRGTKVILGLPLHKLEPSGVS